MEKPPQFVVCAAMRKDGLIVCGARHFDGVMRAVIKQLTDDFSNWEQGFIDQYGNFLSRSEAWKIADKMGQIRRPTGWEKELNPRQPNIGDDGILFSENLY